MNSLTKQDVLNRSCLLLKIILQNTQMLQLYEKNALFTDDYLQL